MSNFSETTRQSLFDLGRVVATHGALDLLDATATDASSLLQRHQSGDWGAIPFADAEENRLAVGNRLRILSSYELGKTHARIWIITEADRSVTTLLLPEEY